MAVWLCETTQPLHKCCMTLERRVDGHMWARYRGNLYSIQLLCNCQNRTIDHFLSVVMWCDRGSCYSVELSGYVIEQSRSHLQ